MKNTEQKIIDIVARQLGINDQALKPTDDIMEDLGADSLDVIEMVMEMEEVFSIEVPDSELEPLTTIQSVIDLVDRHIAA